MPAASEPADAPLDEAPPPALAMFQRRSASSLGDEERTTVLGCYREVPRPPRLLHYLMSPKFFEASNSAQLVDLISAEPLVAARVLAALNSPLYGLKAPVISVGQAVTYLGLNAVRSLCLQNILINAFEADSPERKAVLEETWRASAMASELAQQVSYRLGWSDGVLVASAVVLSFLGRLVTVATLPLAQLRQIASEDFLQRSLKEQEQLGLCCGEIGRLLMQSWALPELVATDAADIDTLLVTPRAHIDPQRSHRLALGYLCARVGDRLAVGRCSDLLNFDIGDSDDVEWFHLRAHLADKRLGRVLEYLRAPILDTDIQRMRVALHC